MATHRPSKMTDTTLKALTWAGTQERYRDPKSNVQAVLNKSGISFGAELHNGGKSKWVTLGKFAPGTFGIAAARKAAASLSVDANKHGLAARQKTFGDAFERLRLRHKREQRQPRTLEGYEYTLRKYTPEIFDMALVDVRRGWLKQQREDLADKIGAPTSINWLRAVSPALSEAVELEWVETNHAKGIKLSTTAKPVEVTAADVKALWGKIDAIGNVWVRSAWRLALLTGLRKSDIASARWEHFDAADATLFLPEPKGGAKRAFTLPLATQVVEDLSALPRLGGEWAQWVFPAPRSASGHIYDHRHPKLPNPHFARHAWSTMAELAGVDEWRRAVLLNQQPSRGINARYTHSKAVEYRAEAQTAADYICALRK